jgi:predicted Holliday junction resolvase-like endonuclease
MFELVGWFLALFLFFVLLAFIIFYHFRFEQRINEWLQREEKRIREDAIARSVYSRFGRYIEKFVPFLKKFGHAAGDVRWLGDPIDFIVFDGYSQDKSKGKFLTKISFVEVKTGKSKLGVCERKIRDLIRDKKVVWEEFRI